MLLYVDSDAADRSATADRLRDGGFEVVEAESLAAAREQLDRGVDALVTEQSLPDGTGLELLREARELAPDTTCILYTDVPLDDIDTEAFGDVVAEYLRKDGSESRDELVELVEHGLLFKSQTAYPLPENEDARLAALERYAADPAALGASFDRLAELAAAVFGVDAAAVGLIDAHEQRFIACHGIEIDSVEREDTVCTYAMLDPGVTVIEDVREDPRFDENVGLAALNIQFYASAPIQTPEGEVIGTFCVYDDEPGSLSDADREHLQLFADEAMDQLTLRRRLRETAGETDD